MSILQAQNVHYIYQSKYQKVHAVKGIDFEFEEGRFYAIVGKSGCGKTTFITLLMRFYDPDGGEIRLDGVNTMTMHRHDLRQNVGMVLQDTWLFQGTIMENIRYGRLDATDEEVIEAAKTASAHSFIMRLEEGYNTIITGDGANLSQGQRQLLSFARTVIHKPQILILDEATSNVDTRTEQHIQRAMRTLMADKTCFVIAHRLSTIRNADMILVVRDGEIVERGTHDSLMDGDTFYKQLYNAQFA